MAYFSERFELRAEPKDGCSSDSEIAHKIKTVMDSYKIQLESLFGDRYNFELEYI